MKLLKLRLMVALIVLLLVFVGAGCTDEMIEDFTEELKKELRKDMEEAAEEQKQSISDQVNEGIDDLRKSISDIIGELNDSISRSIPWLPIDDNGPQTDEPVLEQPELIKFNPPLDGTLWISQAYHNDNHGNRAVDFSANAGSTVYAVGNGVIDNIVRSHPESCAQFRLVLDNSDINVWYVHVKANEGYKNGDTVIKGFPLGTICEPDHRYKYYNTGAHLHLGLQWREGGANKSFPDNFPNLMNYLPSKKSLFDTRSNDIGNAWFSNGEIDFNKVGNYKGYGYEDLSYLLD